MLFVQNGEPPGIVRDLPWQPPQLTPLDGLWGGSDNAETESGSIKNRREKRQKNRIPLLFKFTIFMTIIRNPGSAHTTKGKN